jgi:transcriptional regulator with XRE-family HTH domain
MFTDVDRNIAVNLRALREAGRISQGELAQRMAERGFGFSQATIWKIESGQRPVRASELVALADSLGVMSPMSLAGEPGAARHQVRLRQASRKASGAYSALQAAAAACIKAQIELLAAAREAGDGVTGAADGENPQSRTAAEAVSAALDSYLPPLADLVRDASEPGDTASDVGALAEVRS